MSLVFHVFVRPHIFTVSELLFAYLRSCLPKQTGTGLVEF